jgi:hypothetical protein
LNQLQALTRVDTDAPGSGIQLAVDGDDHSSLLLPRTAGFGLSQVDASGDVSGFFWMFWDGGPDVLKGQLTFDGESRTVAAIDAYLVLRCSAEGCNGNELPVGARREREEFYDADVLGLDVDAEDRIYILTHEGDRSQHRVLLDRISADFTQRETFVVSDGERIVDVDSSTRAEAYEIQIGPQGDVYVWAAGRIGRIALP